VAARRRGKTVAPGPVEHVVIIVKENHCFDNYFGTFPGANGATLDAVVKGGLWPTTVVFVTWDDWGGWFDHVDPENVEQWTDGTQFRYGSRVGCLVLSPFARRGYVSKVRHSHVSLLKFCVQQFGVAAPHERVTAADDMSDCFDFGAPPAPPPDAAPAW